MKGRGKIRLHIKCNLNKKKDGVGYYAGRFQTSSGQWYLEPLQLEEDSKCCETFSIKQEAREEAEQLLLLFPEVEMVSVLSEDVWLMDISRGKIVDDFSTL